MEDEYDSKHHLWNAFEALMAARYGGSNINKLSRESGVGLGTVSRLKDPDTSIGLDKLDKLAKAFSVRPWELLVPGFDPAHLPSMFSPLARDLARALDEISDPTAQRRAFALARQIVELASIVPAAAVTRPAPAPTDAPAPHR